MRRAAILALVSSVSACGPKLDPTQYPTPESLYDASMEAFRRGDFGTARIGFQRLTFELGAREERQAVARYYLAECMFQNHEELEASRQFRRVSDDFPRHPLAPDALLRAGDAYAKLWGHAELDPTYGETALATYQELVGRFPGTPAAERARLRILELFEMFAEKEYRSGVFYLRARAFDSAIIYFKEVLLRYPQTSFAAQSVVRLIEAYDRIGYDDEKRDMCLHLEQYYPGTEGAEEWCAPVPSP